MKIGTYLGSYERVQVEEEPENNPNKINQCNIKNELVPHSDQLRVAWDRVTKLQSILDSNYWSHLTETQKQSLFTVIQNNNALFILSDNELGKLNAPPVYINVADPTPVKGSTYSYPEKAK